MFNSEYVNVKTWPSHCTAPLKLLSVQLIVRDIVQTDRLSDRAAVLVARQQLLSSLAVVWTRVCCRTAYYRCSNQRRSEGQAADSRVKRCHDNNTWTGGRRSFKQREGWNLLTISSHSRLGDTRGTESQNSATITVHTFHLWKMLTLRLHRYYTFLYVFIIEKLKYRVGGGILKLSINPSCLMTKYTPLAIQ